MLLNIITACIRPYNLTHIYNSILNSKGDIDSDIRWWIVIDLATTSLDSKGKEQLEAIRVQIEKDNIIKVVCIPANDPKEAPVNKALHKISKGLVCFIDDDNVMHPNYMKEIHKAKGDKERIGFLYQQNLGKPKTSFNRRTRFIEFYKVKPGLVDSAQFTISRDLIGNIAWPPRALEYQPYRGILDPVKPSTTPDGDFIHKVYTANPKYFVIIKRMLCYYNYLAAASKDLDFSD